MPTATIPSWRRSLQTLHERNGIVEGNGLSSDGQRKLSPPFRVRLLNFNDRGLVIEQPHEVDAGRILRNGARVCLLVIDGRHRWELESVITGIGQFDLNDKVQVKALSLAYPTEARDAQRRSYFRVYVGSVTVDPVLLIPEPQKTGQKYDRGEPAAVDWEFRPFEAKLSNIGAGGIGVIAPYSAYDQIHRCREYRCVVSLPDLSEIFDLRARRVHLEPTENGDHYLGLAFEFHDQNQRDHCVDVICGFNASMQRQQLQRQRWLRG